MSGIRNNRRKHENPAVVVGLNVGGLGIIRTLSQKRIKIIGVDTSLSLPAAYSRLCKKIKCPSIEDDRLVDTLLNIAETTVVKPVLYLCEDVAVMVAAKNYDTLTNAYYLNFPDPQAVWTLLDKKLFSEFARDNNFQIPGFFSAKNLDEIKGVSYNIQYPCIIKPTIRTATYNENAPSKAFRVYSADELLAIYSTISPWVEEVVIQEWIPGDDDAVFFSLMYFDKGSTCLATVNGQKLRQWHPRTGTASIVESVNMDKVGAESTRLFEIVQYRGMGSVEFKRDPRDGSFKLIEATVGRADWLSYLSVASGVNIPYIYYCDIVYDKKPTPSQPRVGVKWIVDDNDIKSAIYYMLKGELTLKKWWHSLKGPKSFAYFDAKDLGPFLFLILEVSLKIIFNTFAFFKKLKLMRTSNNTKIVCYSRK